MKQDKSVIISAFPNYRYDRASNRLFSGFGANIETKPDSAGYFTLKKDGLPHKLNQGQLLSITPGTEVPDAIRFKRGGTLDKDAIINDFKDGKGISHVQASHHISYPTAKKYKDIAEGK